MEGRGGPVEGRCFVETRYRYHEVRMGSKRLPDVIHYERKEKMTWEKQYNDVFGKMVNWLSSRRGVNTGFPVAMVFVL